MGKSGTKSARTKLRAPASAPVAQALSRRPAAVPVANNDTSGKKRASAPRAAPDEAAVARVAAFADGVNRSVVSSDWVFVAPAILIAMVLGAFAIGELPPPASVALALLAMGFVGASWWLRGIEFRGGGHGVGMALAVFYCLVGLPMILFGLALGFWPIGPQQVIPAMTIAVGTLAIAASGGRMPAMALVISGLWAGTFLTVWPVLAIAVAGVGAILAYALNVRLMRRFDVEDELRAQNFRKQSRAEQLLREYEQTGQGWFWETDRRGAIVYVSPQIGRLLGVPSERLIGRPFLSIFDRGTDESGSERTINFHLSTRSSFTDLNVKAAARDKAERWWSVSGRPMLDKYDNFQGFRGSGSDLTETRRSQKHATQLARFDSLTNLANRFQMAEWLEKILDAPQVERRRCAVFFMDLDRFKQVNDTMGHPAGDALLKQVADRLRTTVASRGSVGRLGGDEFQVILPGDHERDDLANLAQRIIESLSQPYSIDGKRVIIGASVGIAVAPAHGDTSEELVRNADLALYAAKDGGRGCFHFYAADLHVEAEERRQLEQDLRDALMQGGLELHYQPQVSTTTECISGFEALLRWNHPKLGYMSPDKFVPIAEDTGLITQIGEWALRTACNELAKWPESVRVAVNVSPRQFSNPALPSVVTNAIASAGIAPERLELEITESVFLNDDKGTESMFAALKGIGVRLSLDDFGTGYSSLGYLKKAPFDKIKIDQSFVRGATMPGSRNGAIIASIVSLAESLGMETTAEGVETVDELDLIRLLGCSHIQGFIYEKPLPAGMAARRLEQGLEAIAQGPRSARAPRQTMLRKVTLHCGGYEYAGTVRNMSSDGAMIEGLWNVPPGTRFDVQLSEQLRVKAIARWSKEDRMGLAFAEKIDLDASGGMRALSREGPESDRNSILRKTA